MMLIELDKSNQHFLVSNTETIYHLIVDRKCLIFKNAVTLLLKHAKMTFCLEKQILYNIVRV